MNPIVIAPATVAPIMVRPAYGVPVNVTPVAVPAIQIDGVPGIPGASGISVLDVEAAQDADGTVTLRFAMSNGAIHEVEFRTGGALPPSDLALAGVAQGLGLAEAVLRMDRALAGSAAATGTASASLAAWLDLAAAAATFGTATGRLAAVLDLAGSARSVAVGEGALALALELAGAVIARADAAGMLRLGADLNLQATAVCRATATSVMLLNVAFVGTAAGRGLASATLLAALDGAGSATGRGLASGSILVARSLAASVSGAALASGAIELAAAAGYDADAQAYFNAMTVQPSDTRKGQIDTLVKGLKSDGIWPKLDWLCLLAAHDAQAGRLNARNPAKVLAAVNLPTFTVDRGYHGDASQAFLDFGERFDAPGNLFSLNSATLGVWCNAQGAAGSRRPHVGQPIAGNRATIEPNTSSNTVWRINDSVSTAPSSGVRTGHRTVTRQSSTSKKAWSNASLVLNETLASDALAAANGVALRNASTYTDDRLAALYSGGAFSDADAIAIHNRLNTFLTAIGAA